jgi:hypothetical protein
MANEITVNASLEYEDSTGNELSCESVEVVKSVTTKRAVKLVQEIGTSEEAIDLGDTSTPKWAYFRNLDPTNYIELKVATSGAIFARLDPDTNEDGKGGFAIVPLGSGAQAPFAIANTAACRMEIMIIST